MRWKRKAARLSPWVLTLVTLLGSVTGAAQTTPLPSTIPVFPLEDIALFPEIPVPLHIFEPRYREMLEDALEGDRVIGMVMLREGHEDEYFGRPPIHEVGCAGVIASYEELPDGRYDVVLQGLSKFRVLAESDERPYRLAEVEVIPETLGAEEREILGRHRPRLLALLSRIAPGNRPSTDELSDEVLVNGLAQFLGMAPMHRLDLLTRDGVLRRAERLFELVDQGAIRATGNQKTADLYALPFPRSAIVRSAVREAASP